MGALEGTEARATAGEARAADGPDGAAEGGGGGGGGRAWIGGGAGTNPSIATPATSVDIFANRFLIPSVPISR